MNISSNPFFRYIIFWCSLLWFTLPANAVASDFDGAQQLLRRRLPWLVGNTEFRQLPDSIAQGADAFRVQTASGRLIIEASSLSAATAAINHYLNYYCHMSISHCGDNMKPLDSLPTITKPETVCSPFEWRYALNYCTYNYSYAFYTWNDWERELDWIALNGVNLMLAPLGIEAVWAETLSEVGFTNQEIAAFIPGPAYTAWWLMGNLEGWGGPMSPQMIRNRVELQKKILARMAELGIQPVMHGFFGMVPAMLARKYPTAPIIQQGLWGSFQRPAVLLPGNELFDRMATTYYRSLHRLYGDSVRFLGGDLFHEGGRTDSIDLSHTATLVQQSMQRHSPGAVWMLQGWNNNPPRALLDGLDKRYTLLVNLAGEITATWESTAEFYGTPWLWGSVNHFGGKTDMGGQLPVVVGEPHRAYAASTERLLRGIGILPEGIHTNPIVYDFALKTAWSNTAPSLDSLISDWINYRYGQWNDNALRAWTLLATSIYGEFAIKGEGTFESIFCARPDTGITSVSTWGPKQPQYDPQQVARALILFRRAATDMIGSETYRYDLVDMARQTLADHARTVYRDAMQAFRLRNKELFIHRSAEFMRLIDLQDRLLATDPHFLLGTWIEKARNYGTNNPYDIDLAEKNARMLITFWGPDDPSTPVHDYANKEWNGLLRDFYTPRWRLFFDMLSRQLNGQPIEPIDFFGMEKRWTEQRRSYSTTAKGNYIQLVDEVIDIINHSSSPYLP